MGNWTTKKTTTYPMIRLAGDAKHYPAKDGKDAATYLFFYDGTKDGEDIPVDARVVYGAEKLATLKKGAFVTVVGSVEFKKDDKGTLRGKIWNAQVYANPHDLTAEAPAQEESADEGSAFD